jgi:hypothetical protein
MSLDVLATLQQVVPLSTHEIESTGQGVLDEIALAGLIGDTLDSSLNVELRQTMVNDISGEEIDAPGKPLLDLCRSFPIIFRLPRANLSVMLSYRPIPALSLLLLAGVAALDLVLAVRTPRLPPVQQGISAKFHTLGQGVNEADAIPLAVDWHFFRPESFVDDGNALGWCGFVFVYFFVFSKGGGHDGPFLDAGLKLRLIFDQTGKVRLL